MNVAQWLAAAGREHPDEPALLDRQSVLLDYAGFAHGASGVAAMLRAEHAVLPGDRVAIHAPNHPDYLVATFGVWWGGAVVVPINAKLHPREVAEIVADAGAKVLLAGAITGEQASLIRDADAPCSVVDLHQVCASPGETSEEPSDRSDSDLAWIFYTSGTTGPPKGAMLSHGNLVAASMSYLADVGPVPPDCHYLYAAPISHGAGLYAPIHVRMHARHVFTATSGFDAADVLDLAERLGQASLFAAPTMVRRMTKVARQSGRTNHGLDTVVYGGGPMYLADIAEALDTFGPCFVQIYGQGESPMTISSLRKGQHVGGDGPEQLARLRSVGTAHSVVSLRVVGADGAALPSGELGEVEVRGSTVMSGYWNDPAATDAALRDGWLRTGDLGVLDIRGFLTLQGRSKEVVITGGSNVYPREVEDVLMQHPDVDEAAVIGVPDQEWGEVVVAFVTAATNDGVTPEKLDAFCLDFLARFKRPKHYIVVDTLPKNANGKILKTHLRAELDELAGLPRHTRK